MPTRILVVLALVAVAVPAHGQPAPRAPARTPAQLAEDVAALRAEVNALKEATVQVPTLAESVREISDKLAVVSTRLEELARVQQSMPEVTTALDAQRRELAALSGQVAEVRMRLADLEQPHHPGVGAGAGVGHTRGFEWATADGRFGLSLEGYAQPRWQADVRAGDDRDQPGVSTFAENTLRMRRARFGGRGWMGSKDFQWKLEMELVRSPPMLDYYLDYVVRPELVIRAGQFKTQFTRNFATGDAETSFPERPESIDRLRYDRDLQVGAWGLVAGERVGWFVTAGNGAGPNRLNDNVDMLLVARGDAVVLGERFTGYGDYLGTEKPALMVGAGAAHDLVAVPDALGDVELRTDVDGSGGRDNVRVISASADAIFRWKGLELVTELVYRREDWGTILLGQVEPGVCDLSDFSGLEAERSYLSIHGEVSYFVLPHRLMVALRAGRAEVPFLPVGGAAAELPPGDRVTEVEGMVQMYGERGRVLGLSYGFIDYDGFIDDDCPGAGTDKRHRLILQAQFRL